MKKLGMLLAGMMLVATSVMASDLSVYGSYWDTDDLDEAMGAGAKLRVGKADSLWLELRGTYFEDLTEESPMGDFELECIPADVGLGFTLVGEPQFSLYMVGGATYFFLDSNFGDVDDELGWYAGGGGEVRLNDHVSIFAEYVYRGVEATVEGDDLDEIDDDEVDKKLNGSVVNVGLVFR